MKLRLMINMINISVKNSQNVAKFVNLTGVMKKPNTTILKQNILSVH